MKHINELSWIEVLDLRKQICLNSCFLRDYENNLEVDPREVLSFFDSYLEYLVELAGDDVDFSDLIQGWDTNDNLRDYYLNYQ